MNNKWVYRFLAALIFLSGTSLSSFSKKTTIKLKPPKEQTSPEKKKFQKTAQDKEDFTEIARHIFFTGYDKKGGSSYESFFVSNDSETPITALELEISYFTEQGKLLHRRKVELKETIPAKETREIDIPSWDKQKNFHYVKSQSGKNGSAPYTVRFKILSFIVE